MAGADQYGKYRSLAVSTMTSGELIILLYDELKIRLNQACRAISKSLIEEANSHIQRSQDIIEYLMEILDMRYPISQNLFDIYAFIYMQLLAAGAKKSEQLLKEVLGLTEELSSAWRQAEANIRTKNAAGGKAI